MRRPALWVIGACIVASTTAAQDVLPRTQGQERTATQQGPLPALGIEVDGETRLLTGIEVVGLKSVAERDLWGAIARPSMPCSFADAAGLARDLASLEAFARIESRLRVQSAGTVTLEIRLSEHPVVRDVVVRGLTEAPDSQIVADLLGSVAGDPSVAASQPWFAELDDGTVRSGVLKGGIEGALRRVMSGLFGAGYRMADASGTLSSDGVLTIDVDEGRIGAVEIVGPTKRVSRSAQQALALEPGRVFLEADVSEGAKRVENELPFLQAARAARPSRALPLVEVALGDDGSQRFSLRETPPAESSAVFAIEGRTLRLFFKATTRVRFTASADDLLRHTPVGGIGVALRAAFTVSDPKNRVHLRLDTFSGTLDQSTREAIDSDIGEYGSALRLQVPALRIADLHVESHGFAGSSDDWRTNRGSTYLSSLLFDRPDKEYYWRSGGSTGITLQPRRRLLLAFETHTDDHRSLPALADSSSIFTPDRRFVNPEVDEGRLNSLVYRAELWSDPVRPEEIVSILRSPDTAIVDRPVSRGGRSAYRLFATLEVARPGSDGSFDFTRFTGDGALFMATGSQRGLSLRARVAGGSHLPLQRQEALGGWSALRGFDFKEFRGGDWSLLGAAEYRHVWISAFADVGSLHRPDVGWSGPHFGAGAKLHIDGLPFLGRWMRDKRLLPSFQLGCAWRLDKRTVARPELRLLVGQAF
jgi:hypothetical protein